MSYRRIIVDRLFAKSAGWPRGWDVKYNGTAAYLTYRDGTMIIVR